MAEVRRVGSRRTLLERLATRLASRPERRDRPHFGAFDGLRAVAIITVVFHHTAPVAITDVDGRVGNVFDHLDIGLPLFFTISGFLIYWPFASARLRGGARPGLGRYLLRRAMRILPAYWVALTATIWYFGRPDTLNSAWDWIVVYGLGQIYSLELLRTGLAQAWSLCVEVTFYLLVPLYAVAIGRLAGAGARARTMAVEVGGLAVLYGSSVAFRAWQLADQPFGPHALRWLPANLDYFALGMALAVLSAHGALRAEQGRPSELDRALGSAPGLWWGAALALWVFTLGPGLPRGRALGAAESLELQFLYGVIATLLLVPAVFGQQRAKRGWVRAFLSSPEVSFVGRISYGIYLWHVSVIIAWVQVRKVAVTPGDLTVLLTVTVGGSLILATLSWLLVERPLIALSHRRSRSRPPEETRPADPPVPPIAPAAPIAGVQSSASA